MTDNIRGRARLAGGQLEVRRSSRVVKDSTRFSPPRDFPKSSGRGVKRKKSSGATIKQDLPYDLGPDGEPFVCDTCGSRYIIHPSKRHKLKGKKLSPRQRYDLASGRYLLLCNACGLSHKNKQTAPLRRPKDPSSAEEKEAYLKEARSFADTLVTSLGDSNAEKLYCPKYTSRPCRCVQSYLVSGGRNENYRKRANHLLKLIKMAQQLSSMKCYDLSEVMSKPSRGKVGIGNGHKKSDAYEDFVLRTRKQLREECTLCEIAVKQILGYSNNFLFKRLKSKQLGCRVEKIQGRGSKAKGMVSIEALSTLKCCEERCCWMARNYATLLQEWRDRSARGQTETRQVVMEMLTPSGLHTNCVNFIRMVTGVTSSVVGAVRKFMLSSGGSRTLPPHGLKAYWANHPKRQKSDSDSEDPPSMIETAEASASISKSQEVMQFGAMDLVPGRQLTETQQVLTAPEGRTSNNIVISDCEILSGVVTEGTAIEMVTLINPDGSTQIIQVPIINCHSMEGLGQELTLQLSGDSAPIDLDPIPASSTSNRPALALTGLQGGSTDPALGLAGYLGNNCKSDGQTELSSMDNAAGSSGQYAIISNNVITAPSSAVLLENSELAFNEAHILDDALTVADEIVQYTNDVELQESAKKADLPDAPVTNHAQDSSSTLGHYEPQEVLVIEQGILCSGSNTSPDDRTSRAVMKIMDNAQESLPDSMSTLWKPIPPAGGLLGDIRLDDNLRNDASSTSNTMLDTNIRAMPEVEMNPVSDTVSLSQAVPNTPSDLKLEAIPNTLVYNNIEDGGSRDSKCSEQPLPSYVVVSDLETSSESSMCSPDARSPGPKVSASLNDKYEESSEPESTRRSKQTEVRAPAPNEIPDTSAPVGDSQSESQKLIRQSEQLIAESKRVVGQSTELAQWPNQLALQSHQMAAQIQKLVVHHTLTAMQLEQLSAAQSLQQLAATNSISQVSCQSTLPLATPATCPSTPQLPDPAACSSKHQADSQFVSEPHAARHTDTDALKKLHQPAMADQATKRSAEVPIGILVTKQSESVAVAKPVLSCARHQVQVANDRLNGKKVHVAEPSYSTSAQTVKAASSADSVHFPVTPRNMAKGRKHSKPYRKVTDSHSEQSPASSKLTGNSELQQSSKWTQVNVSASRQSGHQAKPAMSAAPTYEQPMQITNSSVLLPVQPMKQKGPLAFSSAPSIAQTRPLLPSVEPIKQTGPLVVSPFQPLKQIRSSVLRPFQPESHGVSGLPTMQHLNQTKPSLFSSVRPIKQAAPPVVPSTQAIRQTGSLVLPSAHLMQQTGPLMLPRAQNVTQTGLSVLPPVQAFKRKAVGSLAVAPDKHSFILPKLTGPLLTPMAAVNGPFLVPSINSPINLPQSMGSEAAQVIIPCVIAQNSTSTLGAKNSNPKQLGVEADKQSLRPLLPVPTSSVLTRNESLMQTSKAAATAADVGSFHGSSSHSIILQHPTSNASGGSFSVQHLPARNSMAFHTAVSGAPSHGYINFPQNPSRRTEDGGKKNGTIKCVETVPSGQAAESVKSSVSVRHILKQMLPP